MKSCYVPNCDRSCNFDNSRNMFLVPSVSFMLNTKLFQNLNIYKKTIFLKAPPLLAEWSAVIPQNKRPLTKSDKICSRHFLETDIERYFEHNINGEITQMLRDRPRLKSKTIPTQNLHIVLSGKKKRTLKRKNDESQKSVAKKVQVCLLKLFSHKNHHFKFFFRNQKSFMKSFWLARILNMTV